MRTIWYMGAKTRLTADIVHAVSDAAPRAGAVLDLMSGTAVVAQALASRARVVANDVQAYAAAIARAYLLHDEATKAAFLAALDPERDLGARYREHHEALLPRLAPAVALEDAFLEASGLTPDAPDPDAGAPWPLPSDPAALGRARRALPGGAAARADAYRRFALHGTPAFAEERAPLVEEPFLGAADLFAPATIAARRRAPSAFPYLLATTYYPNVYLGLRQALAIDGLRYALDGVTGRFAAARRAHYLAALLHAASVATSATSHFCQPRGLLRDAEVLAVQARRALSIPGKLVAFSRAIAATVAATRLRPGNAVHEGEWREVYRRWDEVGADVVYADPPYTADNYSRFYHVLEVLTRYDYPVLDTRGGVPSKGRYPLLSQRHRSRFCVRREVEAELRALVQATAQRGAALVLSYGEENGLLLRVYRARGDSPAAAVRRLTSLVEGSYRSVELRKRALLHSGQGDSNRRVTELLLVARGPRAGRRRGRVALAAAAPGRGEAP